MSVSELLQVFPNVPSSTTAYVAEGWPIVEFLSSAGVTSSKSEATRLIRGGGIYVNDRRITDEKDRLRRTRRSKVSCSWSARARGTIFSSGFVRR